MTLELDLIKPAPDPEGSVHPVEQEPNRAALETARLRVAEIDGAEIEGKQDLMAALARSMEFPDYFGGNWDAAEECLRDLEWLESAGNILVVSGAGALWARERELAEELVGTWAVAAETWIEKGKPFHLVLVR